MAIMKKNSNSTWYQLDLSALVFPTLQRRDFSSVYRISMHLKEEINPTIMQTAIDLSMQRFPTYKVAIHKGVFWRYLEPNDRPGPFLKEDIQNPCMPMPFKSNNHYLLRFFYYKNRIAFEAHHCLGDGNGAMSVLQTTVATYLNLLGHHITPKDYVLDINETPKPEEFEDAYLRYATSKVKPKRNSEKTYLFQGTKDQLYSLNIISGIISVKEILDLSRKNNVSITEYLVATLLFALQKVQEAENNHAQYPVRIALPVNLRQFFPSITLRNFITMVYPYIDPRLGDYSFEDTVSFVHNFMHYAVNDKLLCGDITTNAAIQQQSFVRIIPLFIKDIVVRSFYKRVQTKYSSAGLTNLGKITVPKEMEPFIERMDVYMGQPFSSRTNCAIISYQDVLTINFTSGILETDVEREFFRLLVKNGISVKIETNRNMDEF